MKLSSLLVLFLALSSSTFAASRAPTIKDLVLLMGDSSDEFAYVAINDGEYPTMIGRDPSCETLQVARNRVVSCISENGTTRVVGKAGEVLGVTEGDGLIVEMRWNTRAKIKKVKVGRRTEYQLTAK